MKQTIIFLGLLVILSGFAYADLADNIAICYDDSTFADEYNSSHDISSTGCVAASSAFRGGGYDCSDSGDYITLDTYAQLGTDFSCAWWINTTGTQSNMYQANIKATGGDSYWLYWWSPDTNMYNLIKGGAGYQFAYGSITQNVWTHWAITVNSNRNVTLYEGSAIIDMRIISSAVASHNFTGFSLASAGDGTWKGVWANMKCWRRTLTTAEILEDYNGGSGTDCPSSGDVNPPALLNVNCTSCTEDSTPDQEPYETEDTTPTFNVTTDENADCRIGRIDQNYTAMGASRDCSTTGGTNHICTLTVQDKFADVGENYLYMSCIDGSGNEGNMSNSSKSNSGPIWMEIQGAGEASGDDRIEIGIDTSEIAGIANKYSGQQLSARNLVGAQFSGTFDWVVAVQGSTRRYAFNYVSAGESAIQNILNLTPVLYVLQLQNQTNETITDDVGKLINSTYP